MIKYFKTFFARYRFPILRPGDGSDELQHIVLLQGMAVSDTTMMSSLDRYLLVLQVDQSWTNSTVQDVLTSVPDYEECRALCRVSLSETTVGILRNVIILKYQDQVGCEGWTWISKASADYSEHCLIFSSLGDIENYPDCVRKGKIFFYFSQNPKS